MLGTVPSGLSFPSQVWQLGCVLHIRDLVWRLGPDCGRAALRDLPRHPQGVRLSPVEGASRRGVERELPLMSGGHDFSSAFLSLKEFVGGGGGSESYLVCQVGMTVVSPCFSRRGF
jgi:hypothetical protein